MLDDFAGLGPVRRAALLDHFGSIDRLRAASVEEIGEVAGFGSRMTPCARCAFAVLNG